MKEEIAKADSITLIMDGWKNVNNEPIINIVACLPKPLFVKSVMTGNESHTAENMKKLMETEIESIGAHKVYSFDLSMY